MALDSLHDDFETTTTTMLERGDKTINKIQLILASSEAKFISKRTTGVTRDLAMMSKGRNFSKRKAASDNKCYNCHKLGHFGRGCTLPDQRNKKKKSDEAPNHRQWKRNCAHIAAVVEEDDSDPEPFRPGMANMAKETDQQAPIGVWYLDYCASRYLTNNKDLFIDELRPKCLDFTTAGGQTLCAESIRAIAIPRVDGFSIRLEGVAFALEYDLNLISLGKLRDSKITYVNNADAMILMHGVWAIAHARQDRNLFILDLVTPNKVMQAT